MNHNQIYEVIAARQKDIENRICGVGRLKRVYTVIINAVLGIVVILNALCGLITAIGAFTQHNAQITFTVMFWINSMLTVLIWQLHPVIMRYNVTLRRYVDIKRLLTQCRAAPGNLPYIINLLDDGGDDAPHEDNRAATPI